MASETIDHEIMIKNLLRRLKEMDQFKHSGSVQEGEIEKLQEKGRQTLGKEGGNPRWSKKEKMTKNAIEQERLKADMEEMKKLNETLDKCEERFRKYNLPKRYQNGHKQPLKAYVERLHEFMEITWRRQAKKNRAKGYWSLIELMTKIDHAKEDGLVAFSSLANSLSQLGTKISNVIIEYIFLIIIGSNESEETVSLSLRELVNILECLSVDENYVESVVVNTFVLVVRFFIFAMNLVGPFWDKEKISLEDDDDEDEDDEKVTFYLDEETKEELVHNTIMEVVRLEVSICSPDLPMMLINDVLFSMSKHLDDNVFKEKLERVAYKINQWKKDFEFVLQESDDDDDDQDQGFSEMKFLRQVLEAGVLELWTVGPNKSRALVNLVMV